MNKTATITFLPHNRQIPAGEGTSLIRAAMDAGVHINASCGGEGVCGKCRIIVEQGGVEGGISEQINDGVNPDHLKVAPHRRLA